MHRIFNNWQIWSTRRNISRRYYFIYEVNDNSDVEITEISQKFSNYQHKSQKIELGFHCYREDENVRNLLLFFARATEIQVSLASFFTPYNCHLDQAKSPFRFVRESLWRIIPARRNFVIYAGRDTEGSRCR